MRLNLGLNIGGGQAASLILPRKRVERAVGQLRCTDQSQGRRHCAGGAEANHSALSGLGSLRRWVSPPGLVAGPALWEGDASGKLAVIERRVV
jgi:hypothetical protein